MNFIDLSIAYSLWCGFGIAAISLIAIIYFGEPVNLANIVGLVKIILGSIILTLFGAEH